MHPEIRKMLLPRPGVVGAGKAKNGDRSAGVSRAGRAYGEENVPRNAPRGRNEDDQSEEVAAQEGKGRRERRQGEAEADACNSQRKRSSCTLLPPNYVSSLAL